MRRFTKLLPYLRKEFFHVMPVFIFFFIAFNIINWTEGLILKQIGVVFTMLDIIIAAGLIAKVLLVLDHLPITEFLPKRPLFFRILWKSSLYWIVAFIIRQALLLIHYFSQTHDLQSAWQNYLLHLNPDLIIAIQSWCLMLMVLFVTARELIEILRPQKMARIFFSKK